MKKNTLKVLILIIALFWCGTITSQAAITASSKTVNSGENVTISVTSSQSLGAYTVSVADNGGLTFVTSSGQEGSGKTIISGSSTSGVTSLATFTFKTPAVSETKAFNVKISATGMETPNLEPVSNSTATAKVTVVAKSNASSNDNTGSSSNDSSTTNNNKPTESSKSSNANLSNLVVTPVDFKGFKASKTSGYSVTVENNVTKVGIKATTKDSKAKVSISGNENLKVGENVVNITVTAEDGTKKTYKVSVIRKAENEESKPEKNNVIENEIAETSEIANEIDNEIVENVAIEKVFGLSSLKITGETDSGVEIEPNLTPAFDNKTFEYSTTVPVEIKSIKVDAVANAEGATVEIMGNENLTVGENVITILVKSANGEEQQSYQIIVNKTEDSLNLGKSQLTKNIILIAIIVIIFITIIVLIVIYRRQNRKGSAIDNTIGKDITVNTLANDDLFATNENEKNKNSFDGKKSGKRFK